MLAALCALLLAPPGQPAAPLQGDARLRVRLELAQKDSPLGEALAAAGAAVGVPLTASADVADDRITVFLDRRPAAESLWLMASHFGFRWIRKGNGYILIQPEDEKLREAGLRRRDRLAQVEALEARMRRIISLAGASRDELETRAREIEARLRAGLLVAEHARLTEERTAIGDLLRPGAGAAVAAYRALTPEQQQRLRAGTPVHLCAFDKSLPQEAAERILAAVPATAGGKRQADATLWFTDEAGMRFSPETAHLRSLRLEARMSAGDGRGVRSLEWRLELPREVPSPKSKVQSPKSRVQSPNSGTQLPAPSTQHPTPNTQRPAGPVLLPGADRARRPPASRKTGWPAGLLTVGDVAEVLHRVGGLEVIADSFTRARLDVSGNGKRTADEILDDLAARLRYEWKREDGVVRLRSRVYYQDRAQEAPERVVRAFRSSLIGEGRPTLDSLSQVAASVDDDRARGLHELWGWYLEGTSAVGPDWAGQFYANRHHLRFWASLSAPQRRAALQGAVLTGQSLSGPQRRAYEAVLLAPPSRHDPLGAGPSFPADQPGACRFQIMQRRVELVTTASGGDAAPRRWTSHRIRYVFNYYLAGRTRPVRTGELELDAGPAGG